MTEWLDPWWSVIGLSLDIVGFTIIAFEWRTSMYDHLARLELELSLLALRMGELPLDSVEISPKARKFLSRASPKDIADDTKFDHLMNTALILDATDRLNRRRGIFIIGFVLVLVGFVVQLVGSWPN